MDIEITDFLNNNEYLIQITFDEVSYIQGIIYKKYGELYINYLHVNPLKRNIGIGTKLIQEIINISTQNYNIISVHLDDTSSHYRHSNNIYIKYGFKYKDNINISNKSMILLL